MNDKTYLILWKDKRYEDWLVAYSFMYDLVDAKKAVDLGRKRNPDKDYRIVNTEVIDY